MSRFTMFLYVEGQLIQYFCFECTQSKSTMYIIKIHLLGLTVCMMLESQRWGWYLNTMRWQHSWQNVDRIEKCGKIGLNPGALTPQGLNPKDPQKYGPLSLSIQNGKRNGKVKEKIGKVWMDTVEMAPRLHFSVADFRFCSWQQQLTLFLLFF